mmetsp:Transcript_41802/g.81940  ORF Transcript_41802/g.81940 Transcript_41802/m.81940 type:complete len:250 (-) Transcript_41802:458-1207(-)
MSPCMLMLSFAVSYATYTINTTAYSFPFSNSIRRQNRHVIPVGAAKYIPRSVVARTPHPQHASPADYSEQNTRLLASVRSDDAVEGEAPNLTLVYEGRSVTVPIFAHETILAAMERSNAGFHLSFTQSSSDCRRGSCLTCAGRVVSGRGAVTDVGRKNEVDADFLQGGGKENGGEYVLTCSSLASDDVTVELGVCEEVWVERFMQRLASEDTRSVGREACAREMRIASEKNVIKWKNKMEKMVNADSSD